jgi:hypothetical protein
MKLQLDHAATPQVGYRAMTRCFALLALVLLAACERPGERTSERALAAKVLTGVLAYPRSTVVSVSAGQDAAEVVLTTPAPPPAVATWYRQALKLNGWRVKNDQTMADGSLAIYADSGGRGGRPLWITLRANQGGPGTTYTLIGAVVARDTARGGP